MAGPSERLLRTKLLVPPLRPLRVLRPALLERLNRGLGRGCRFTLASAPPGYGKTTLIAEWVGQLGRPVAWFSVEGRDNEPLRFWRYVVAALHLAIPQVGEDLPWPSASDAREDLAELLGGLLNQLVANPVPCVLVLDDYQAIEADAVHRSLNLFLDQVPGHVHVVMTTRTDPPVNLWLRRGRLQVQEVRAQDLSLSLDQTAEFLSRVMDLALSAGQIRALHARSEGWITGLQLAALSLARHEDPDRFIAAFAGSNRDVSEYLVGEVLRRQPDDVEQFLLHTSILERLSPALCDAVTGRTDSDQMLERLEHANLFLQPIDAERRWFRYHPLFSTQVQAHYLRRAPLDVEEGHRRASEWFEAKGSASEAIRHALAGRDYPHAVLLLDHTVMDLAKQGQVFDFDTWLSQVPAETTHSNPRLGLAFVWAAMYRGDLRQVRERLAVVERLLERQPEPDRTVAADYACQVASLRAWLALFQELDPIKGREYAERATAFCPGLEPSIQAGAFHCLAHALYAAGDIPGADRAFGESVTLAQAGQSIYSEVLVTYFWVGYLLELGQLRLARELCLWLVARCQREAGGAALLTTIYYALALIDYERNDLASASTYLELVSGFAMPVGYAATALRLFAARIRLARSGEPGDAAPMALPDFVSFRSAAAPGPHAIDLWLRLGQVDAARMAARSWGLNGLRPSIISMAELLAWARILRAGGDPQSSLELLDWLDVIAGTGGLKGHLIQLRIQQALAYREMGDGLRAHAAITDALDFAQGEQYCRSFVDAGPEMAGLLRGVSGSASSDGHAAAKRLAVQLLPAFPAHAAEALPPLAEPLTAREREVLSLLARQMSYGEISETLVISLNTVRTHIKSIYAKLSASSAEEAVERGAAYHLLDAPRRR